MPIYKGSTEVTSGNLRKGSTNIENGYKETSPFYTNTNGITINFIDAISGATMSTTQFSSVGVPGASFSSFSRTITTDSGRIFSGTVSVAEAGDGGNNVSASISGQGSTTATLNVSGTYPTQGVTVTLTVNGATQVQLPNLVVTKSSGIYPKTTTGDGGALGTYNYSISNSADCVGGSSGSGSINGGSGSSHTYYSYSQPGLAGGPYGNGCGVTCNSSFTSSKSGYNSGGTTFSQTGGYPSSSGTVTANIWCIPYQVSSGVYVGFNSCPGGIFPAAAQPQSVATTCGGTNCNPASNPPAAGTCSGQTSGSPSIDTNNFTLNQSAPAYVSGATNGGSQAITYTISGITAQWTITCPGGGAGMSQAQLIANCSLVQNGTNITITSAPYVTGASGACSVSNPPLVCGGGSWSNTNGTPTPTINLGCTRPPCQ